MLGDIGSTSAAAIAVYALIAFLFIVLLAPLLYILRAQSTESFFQVPYITWYLLHYFVAVIGVSVVAILALLGSINSTTVAALLSGLFGYVLGSTSRGAGQQQQGQQQQQKLPAGQAPPAA
jgi:hypothetical protein